MTAVVLAAFACTAGLHAATKPKPWQWTPQHATDRLSAALHAAGLRFFFDFGDEPTRAVGATCRGMGKPVQRHYVAFTCRFRIAPLRSTGQPVHRRAWMRIRPRGTGSACFSLTGSSHIDPVCLNARDLAKPLRRRGQPPSTPAALAAGMVAKAMATRFKTGPAWVFNSNNCFGEGGYYSCRFRSRVSGTAIVLTRGLKRPTVRFTSLDCKGKWAGRRECVIS